MIVSHAHRFIYIKTYKTASTSIEAALSEICGPDDVITPASEPLMRTRASGRAQNYRIEHPLKPKRPLWRKLLGRPERQYHPSVGFYEHMPAWRVKAYVGDEVWSRYYKFTFERNPWDRQVSWYYYKTKSKPTRPGFEYFLANKRNAYVENYDLYTLDGNIALDFVGRYEDLKTGFKTVLEAIGLQGKVELPLTNTSPDQGARDYRQYYTQPTRELIAAWYDREIRAFNYSF